MRILFADDELSIQELMRIELPRLGHEVTICPDGRTAVVALDQSSFDCIVVDLDMPGISGLDVIAKMRQSAPETEAVIITGKSSIESAVTAMRHGVCDYLTKPCRLADIQAVLERVRQRRELSKRLRALEGRIRRAEGVTSLVGSSAGLEQVRRAIARVAPTDSAVLIRGETGTGKEVVARLVHESSSRANKMLVAINCGAMPEQLVESELFGHRKGAFTGAEEHRAGLFEMADGGTIFLDEIGELPKSLQPRLLRVLENGEIRRVGENQSITVDVRVICATHRPLEEMVESGSFREDLFFRINTFEIPIPSLRDRPEDIPLLVDHFVRRNRQGIPPHAVVTVTQCMEVLTGHRWPGNVRELANVVEHALVLSDELPLQIKDLPERYGVRMMSKQVSRPNRPLTLRDIENRAILEGLDRNGGNKVKTADDLGISLKTLYNKLHQATEEPLDRTA
ncbi:MAG: sigma-54 dependent transcriptional regulator [Planctomycetota bacterium]|nr:sigma-54 dependent transcriptional regulator [Planctomycetia bacterium]RLS29228.1 MAG: sigma-54-dependent Fis family transcriptional regulator [Planctomycetota bacterium]RLS59594.1 MAG: sigma-54-dependent Fis family transcriptional regulator [Planctomycetota bacterium]